MQRLSTVNVYVFSLCVCLHWEGDNCIYPSYLIWVVPIQTVCRATIVIGTSLSEPQGVMMSTALACVHACVPACVHTYVLVGEACLGTSEVIVAGNE